jgi:hypothetical protein
VAFQEAQDGQQNDHFGVAGKSPAAIQATQNFIVEG